MRTPLLSGSDHAGWTRRIRLELHVAINKLMAWLFPTALTAIALAFPAAKLS